MLIFAIKPGHDGGIAAIEDGRLLFSLESEKDSFPRYTELTAATVLQAAELCDRLPDLVAIGGWFRRDSLEHRIGAGYRGQEIQQSVRRFFGKDIRFFSSSHERSHLMMALGMAPQSDHPLRSVLVWEGFTGSFYLVDQAGRIVHEAPVLDQPGVRYASPFSLADPSYPDDSVLQRFSDAGKLMALAAYGDAESTDPELHAVLDRLMAPEAVLPLAKSSFRGSPIHNAGVRSQACTTLAALISKRIFDTFTKVAERQLPAGTPLYISGGCGLNCDWNGLWRQSDHFSQVFVPPCTNDSGSAIGTGIDALFHNSGEQRIDWDVYSGLAFDDDAKPSSERWHQREVDLPELSRRLADGAVLAWVQGRCEIGPRALGNRSLLAEPYRARTRDRLNQIKLREDYRPIAPCCRIEDVGRFFDGNFADPHMLYFRTALDDRLGAVIHVDGTARVQTVAPTDNQPLYALLSAFADRTGAGVLCNTSLNFNGYGFINRMSDLAEYCEARGVEEMVVGDRWFSRVDKEDAR